MKLLYTKKFKEILSQPWKNISLGKVKLRGGTKTGLTRKDISKVLELPDSFSGIESTQRTYDSEMVCLPGGGIQIYLDIPREDQSFHTEDYYYQVIMFFYTDLLTGEESLAFVCYEKIDYITSDIPENDEVIFIDLTLTSRKNIITIPSFSWSCNINFSQSEIIKYLEDPIGDLEVKPFMDGTGYVSRESWKAWMVDSLSTQSLTPWIETTYLNKYGIKIY